MTNRICNVTYSKQLSFLTEPLYREGDFSPDIWSWCTNSRFKRIALKKQIKYVCIYNNWYFYVCVCILHCVRKSKMLIYYVFIEEHICSLLIGCFVTCCFQSSTCIMGNCVSKHNISWFILFLQKKIISIWCYLS